MSLQHTAQIFGPVLTAGVTACNSDLSIVSSGTVEFNLGGSNVLSMTSAASNQDGPISLTAAGSNALTVSSGNTLVELRDHGLALLSSNAVFDSSEQRLGRVAGYDNFIITQDPPEGVRIFELHTNSVIGSTYGSGLPHALKPKMGHFRPDSNIPLGTPLSQGLINEENTWLIENSAVRMNFTNRDSGSRVSMHWRPNNLDELELIKLVDNHDPVVLARFGRDDTDAVSDTVFGSGSVKIVGITTAQGAASPDAVANISYSAVHPSLGYTVHAIVTDGSAALPSSVIAGSAQAVASPLVSGRVGGSLSVPTVHPTGVKLASLRAYTAHLTIRDSAGGFVSAVRATFQTTDTQDPVVAAFSVAPPAGISATSAKTTFNLRVTDDLSLKRMVILQSTSASLTEAQVAADPSSVVTALSGTSHGPVAVDVAVIPPPFTAAVHNYLLVEDSAGNRSMAVVQIGAVSVQPMGAAAVSGGAVTPAPVTTASTSTTAMAIAVLNPGAGTNATQLLNAAASGMASNASSASVSVAP